MKDFSGKLAVITGGGTGMGRELAKQLVEQGCDVAICDVVEENMAETLRLCRDLAPQGISITAHLCDVSSEEDMNRFRAEVEKQHPRGHINLLFNNAGIGGGGSFINDTREHWEKTFAVCWYGVYYGSRAFVPLLIASDDGHLVNTSSVNGFWASLGPMTSHTAYSAAKFAVKGFSEALVNDFRLNAPHVKVSVVMPGHIGTDIAINSGKILGAPDVIDMSDEELEATRENWKKMGADVDNLSKDELRSAILQRGEDFRNNAPMTAAEAVAVILNGVKEERWRILVGDDAHNLDQRVRNSPEEAYESSFFEGSLIGGGILKE
ncbi:MAG: NAD(P)-dependent dehydrogenase (short-subunit alcohol dehydrogenase family) [Gammaproteobacteria bacterium]|jgi:NAD(P)-dependent dehydrogenase (short-subunit alcohol dehydrogenase family)